MDMASHMVCFGGVLGCLFYFGCMGQLKEYKISVSIAKLKMT